MGNFQSALEDYELTDLGFKGPKYTWTNCCEGLEFIKERLDRGVANPGWRDIFPEAEIFVEVLTTSDHAVLTVQLTGQLQKKLSKRRFRFEACWVEEKKYQEVFLQAWNQSSGRGDTWERCGEKLTCCY
jgi:hypothetical protein